jgi:hypothetical protein
VGTKLEYKKIIKHEYHEELWRMKILLYNSLLAKFIQSTQHLPKMEEPARNN